jgi:hypothetical protein
MFALLAGGMACHHPAEQWGTCSPIEKATRVEVHSWSLKADQRTTYVITDVQRIQRLIAFANARRDAFRRALYTMPASPLTVDFCDGANFVGAFDPGTNYFFVSCANWKGIRNASSVELAEFQRLIAPVK